MMSKIFDFGRIKAGRDMDLYVNMLNEPKIEKLQNQHLKM